MPTKVTLPWLKNDVGLGDVVQQIVDPNHKYIGCSRCRARQQMLNSLLSFSAPQPPASLQPKPLPSDAAQMYQARQVDDESQPDGGM